MARGISLSVWLLALSFFSATEVASAPASDTLYQAPSDLSDGLTVGNAADHGLSIDALNAMAAARQSDSWQKIDSILIMKDSTLIFESYHNFYAAGRRHDMASITKSITSLLVGIAIDQGHISGVDTPIYTYYTDTPYNDYFDEAKRAITIEDVLTMRHGLDCDDAEDTKMKRFRAWLRSADRMADILSLPMVHEPGTHTAYCTMATDLLRPVLEGATGMSVQDFAQSALFSPLGISNFGWNKTDPDQLGMGYNGSARPRDVIRIGQMVADQGVWQDEQIVSSGWIEQSFTPRGQLYGVDYGYLWYSEPYEIDRRTIPSRLAMGQGGQLLILFPTENAVVMINAHDWDGKLNFYDFVAGWVLPAIISDRPE